ncbi:MAG: electron transfer flavoprotein subunit alpha/FixB family protein [Anaerolineales bacterium]|nr:electron transfer flavoprotein subunit alpha/FixB family protein [Anaerolineales bacterium]
MATKLWVFIEQFKGVIAPASLEALGAARTLGGGVTGLLFGQGVGDLAQSVIAHGADEVLVADDASLADFRVEAYAALLVKLAREHAPALLLAGATTAGRDLFGAAAVDLEAGCLADAVGVKLVGGVVQAVRPVYAGKLLADVTFASGGKPQLVTLRPRAFPKPEPDAGRTGTVTSVAPALAEDAIGVKVLDYVIEQGQVSLADAKIIVSGGRGVGGAEGFGPVRDLAQTLGGAMGASRAAVDAGWIPYAHQVGQTGKTVAPDLYIAAGISGSIQHQAGMRSSKVIVAVNKDPEAPIFKVARYGVVGDLFKILPALTAEFKKRLGK